MLERMTRKEAAAYLHISTDTLDRRRAAGKIRAIRDGGLVFYERAELDRYHNTLKAEAQRIPYSGTFRKRRVRSV